MFNLQESIEELYKITATQLPYDIIQSLQTAEQEEKGNAKIAIEKILENSKIAKKKKLPLCQDTGTPIFYIFYNKDFSQKELTETIQKATENATKTFLRPNSVDPLTEKNLQKNSPELNFIEWEEDYLRIDLMLKGGGCENASTQYSIPCEITSERNLSGVKEIVLEHITNLQGKACPPGILGVCIGGTRVESLKTAQRQLFRKITDSHKDQKLADFEKTLLKEVNSLGIGPMAFSGKNTLFSLKLHSLPRHPASFFVSLAYSCWACRRHSLKFFDGGVEFD